MAKAAILTIVAICIGVVAWRGEPLLLPVAMLFPALWAMAPMRTSVALLSAAYFLTASRDLPQGVINFYGSGMGAGLALWVAAAAGFVIVHVLLWTARPGWRRAMRYGVAALLMSVPPFGIVGWAHPITAAGIVFPGWGWWGLAAAAIGLLAMTTKVWPIATLVLGGAFAWSAAIWTVPTVPEGWQGINTSFQFGEAGQYTDYAEHMATIRIVKQAAEQGAATVVLPESAFGIWTTTTEGLWIWELADLDVVVNGGAIVIDRTGYDNVMIQVSGEGAAVIYRERMPVPVSMWQPWTKGGARAYFFTNPVVEFAGVRIAPLICYEQLIIWPVLQSMLYAPEVIVATGNGWWTGATNIVAIQRASAEAWAALFGLPVVVALNY